MAAGTPSRDAMLAGRPTSCISLGARGSGRKAEDQTSGCGHRGGLRGGGRALVGRHLERQLWLCSVCADGGESDSGDVPHDGLVGELELELREEDGKGDLCGGIMESALQFYEINSGTYSFRVGRI